MYMYVYVCMHVCDSERSILIIILVNDFNILINYGCFKSYFTQVNDTLL